MRALLDRFHWKLFMWKVHPPRFSDLGRWMDDFFVRLSGKRHYEWRIQMYGDDFEGSSEQQYQLYTFKGFSKWKPTGVVRVWKHLKPTNTQTVVYLFGNNAYATPQAAVADYEESLNVQVGSLVKGA